MKLIARTLAVSLALAPAVALAAGKDKSTRTVDSKNPDQLMGDARIAAVLHHVNMDEIKAGQLAQTQGQSQAIKDYGRTLETDHKSADAKLTSIASKANLDLNALSGPDKQRLSVDKKKMEQVKKMNGADFDRAFAEAMYEGHKGVLKMLDDHAKEIQSADLKQFVDDTKPVLEHHRDMADKLRSNRAQGRSEPLAPRPIK